MKNLRKLIGFICLIGIVFSCEDYLERTVQEDLTIEEVFKNFDNSQGFVEEMYAMIVDYSAPFWSFYSYYGEDSIGVETWIFDYSSDEGRYWDWQNNFNYFSGNPNTSSGIPFEKSAVWPSSWAGIRKSNIVIENVETLMVNATQQEKDAILGQAYFFRAFFHHEVMKFWGSMPYIDRVLENDWKIERPKEWAETALKIDKDFDKAIELLPEDWDDTNWAPGEKTRGQNMFRLTKGAALALKAKNLLFAASPLMQNSNDTYGYDAELCRQAADAFAKLIQIPRYRLEDWSTYESVFYTVGTNRYPDTSEYIFGQSGFVGWFGGYMGDSWQLGAIGQSNAINSPTHNYIHNYFGMKDGLSCDDSPLYDPENPWENRDPRFYKWIVVDGDQLIDNLGAVTGSNAVHRYAEFFDGGEHRFPGKSNGTRTGYVSKKWYPRAYNKFDNGDLFAWRVHVRLTDVYLMYAEAAVIGYGINGKPSGFNLSALDAINKIRERAVPDGSLNVKPINLTSTNVFMEEIRRERAVEMSWENHRWMDIRRWKQGTNMKYKLKTGLRFDRNNAGKPINFVEEVLRTRVFDDKHYWLPLPQNDTELYEGFPQNPGW